MKHRHFTRRDFVKGTLAAVAAPLILPSSAWARVRTPADRINLGFIGMGKMGRHLMGGFLDFSDVQVVAISDIHAARLGDGIERVHKKYSEARASGTYQGCAGYRDFRELIAREDIDAVVVATPDHWHEIPSVLACGAGKDVYCEKPLSLTIAEARRMVTAARKNNCVFQTGSQQRSEYDGRFRTACELVRSGRIGKVHTVHVGVGVSPRPCDLPEETLPGGIDWDMWLGPAPWRGYNEILCPKGVHDHFPKWRDYREYAGGMMADFGAHHFDIAQWGLNMDHTGPVEIIPPPGGFQKGLIFKYANGVTMIHGGKDGVTFEGTDGSIYVNRPTLTSTPESIVKEPLGENDVRLENPGGNHRRNWIDCIRSRKKPIADVEIGARTATICHLANIGYELRRNLRWDPKREKFVKDSAANQLLDRPKRAPWRV